MKNCTFLNSFRLGSSVGLLGVILAAAGYFSSAAWSLSCTRLDNADIDVAITEAFDRSDIVFVGRPVQLHTDLGPTDVKVTAAWKGPNLAIIPMSRLFLESEERVIFASRYPVGGWRDSWPECVSISSDEMKRRLKRLFGHPSESSLGNREDYELLIAVSIFLLSGFLVVGIWTAIRYLSGDSKKLTE